MIRMTGKERLQTLLDGGIPDAPPTWELVFQIQQEFFGMDRRAVATKAYGSEAAKRQALRQFDFDVYERCVEELGWAAIPGSYDPDELRFRKEKIGDRALVAGFEGDGVFWMPSGATMVDFAVRLYEARIRESAQYGMRYGGIGKPYIFSTSNCVFKGMPVESYRVMLDEYGRLCEAVSTPTAGGPAARNGR